MRPLPFLLAAAAAGSAIEHATHGRWTVAAFAAGVAVLVIRYAREERP